MTFLEFSDYIADEVRTLRARHLSVPEIAREMAMNAEKVQRIISELDRREAEEGACLSEAEAAADRWKTAQERKQQSWRESAEQASLAFLERHDVSVEKRRRTTE